MDVEILKAQHRRIIRLASGLGGLADMLKTPEDAAQARDLMRSLDAALSEHLAIEDGELYPVLMRSEDEKVRVLAQAYVDDMGAVSGLWAHYFEHWSQAAILSDRPRFAAATKGLIGALAHRVASEDDNLYPAMIAAGAGKRASVRDRTPPS